jgi:hypothetical protein
MLVKFGGQRTTFRDCYGPKGLAMTLVAPLPFCEAKRDAGVSLRYIFSTRMRASTATGVVPAGPTIKGFMSIS